MLAGNRAVVPGGKMTKISLDSLIDGLSGISCEKSSDCGAGVDFSRIQITGVTTDPKLCRPGFLYVAAECETVDSNRYGVRLDGRDYIAEALQNGAAAILMDPPSAQCLPVPLISHAQPLSVLGAISSRFFGAPRPKQIALVTGTNGKTSTVNFCRMLWSAAGLPACSIGNLGGVCSDGTMVWDRDPVLSVPETVTMHEMFHKLALRGIDHVAMEATSHAIFDYRLHGVPAAIGAFTNLTRDHLDFHQTMDEYFRVKMILFEEVLAPGSWAVLNADADWFEPALAICKARGHEIISFGFNASELRLVDCVNESDGQVLALEIYGKNYKSKLNLPGLFQTSNVLCSLAICIASGMAPQQAVDFVTNLTVVEGRLETVAYTPAGGRVIVDYAHTPDGIRAALEACRSFTKGELYVLFGCNGERDTGKRPAMGAIAAALADRVIVTDGHPRGEDPAAIRRDVLAAAPGASEMGGRAEAVEASLKLLRQGDTLLVAGMGHENFQAVAGKRLPYSDRETVRRSIASAGQAGDKNK
jgi:UDP-N-acetylmuramoyl-L-alanyl-D-glutamate--2,6-diaminopimelate ligase